MLTIIIQPNALIFRNLPPALLKTLQARYPVALDRKGRPALAGDPEDLYKYLLLLAKDYDIEII